MMSIEDRFVALLMDMGVAYTHYTDEKGSHYRLDAKTKGVDGYRGFLTEFHFAHGGSFLSIGIWE